MTLRHEKSATQKKQYENSVTRKKSDMKRVQHEKRVQYEKSATRKKCNMEIAKHEKSATRKRMQHEERAI